MIGIDDESTNESTTKIVLVDNEDFDHEEGDKDKVLNFHVREINENIRCSMFSQI